MLFNGLKHYMYCTRPILYVTGYLRWTSLTYVSGSQQLDLLVFHLPNVSNKYFASQFQSVSMSLNDAAFAITN